MNTLIESISASATNRAAVDLTEKSMALAAGVVWRIVFGKRFEEGKRFHEVVSEAESLMGSYSGCELFGGFGKIVDWVSGRERKVEKVFNELNALFQEVIDEHLCPHRPKPDHDDIIDVLLGINNNSTSSSTTTLPITHENIKAILLVINHISHIFFSFLFILHFKL